MYRATFTIFVVFAILAFTGRTQSWNYVNQKGWAGNTGCIGQASPASWVGSSIPCGYYNNFNLSLTQTSLTPQWNTTFGNVLFQGNFGTLYADVNGSSPIQGNYTQTYTAQFLLFHTPSENFVATSGMPTNTNNIEVQLYFQNSAGQYAIVSVTAALAQTVWAQQNPGVTTFFDVIPTTNTATTFNLPALQTLINNNVNVLVYNGSLTVPNPGSTSCANALWFVYAPNLWLNSSTSINNFYTLFTGQSPTGFTNAAGNQVNNNAATQALSSSTNVLRYCWGNYYKLTIPYNYGLWFAIVLTIIYFIYTLSQDPIPVEDADYKTNVWTHHPLFSINWVGNQIHTRKSRTTLLWINIINIMMFTAIFAVNLGYSNLANIFLVALYGVLCGIGTTYIHGFFLRKFYLAKKKYAETDEEKWDSNAQAWIFVYYFIAFLWMWGGYVIYIWQMSMLHGEISNTNSNYWVASFFIALALDWAVLDVIAVFLAYIPFFQAIFKWKGYIYDKDVCHFTYMKLNAKKVN